MLQKLTKAEEEVMQMLWDIGRGTVSDLLDKHEEPKPPHSTISSVMRILEKKGYVDHKAYGKTYDYFPLIRKEDYGKSSLREVLSNYFGGSAMNLVSHLMENKALSKKDLDEVMEKLNKMD